MLQLEPQHVHMHMQAKNKAEALQCLTDILVADHLVNPEYLMGLTAREEQGPTYLGQGIAIPHGTPQSRQYIQQTGIRLAHFPEGVIWDGTHKVYLAIVIAAKSDEHLEVLQILTRALINDVSETIQHAKTPEQIIGLLQTQPSSFTLHENLIQTNIDATDFDDFIWLASQRLKQNHVQAGFISQLNPKSAIQLHDNIWSITGTDYVKSSAVSVIQSNQSISFQNKSLKTLICIAANNQVDHQKLQHLLDVLFHDETLKQIENSQSADEIANLIGAETIPDWPAKSVILSNAHGLHARPATALVNLTKTFEGEILVAVDQSDFVSAKSLTKLLSLGCKRGQTLRFIAEPETDAALALDQIIQTVQSGLGEDVDLIADSPAHENDQSHSHDETAQVFEFTQGQGIAASSGLAFGPAHVIKPKKFQYERYAQSIKSEKEKLEIALHTVKNTLHQFISKSESVDIKQIFMAHLELLDDPDLIKNVHKAMNSGLSSAAAWSEYIEQAVATQAALTDRHLAERAADLRDIGDKVLTVLCGETATEESEQPYILVMHDVGPGDVARLDKDRVAGILTSIGGSSAHSAIVARALGIPAIVGAGEKILEIANNTIILINGDLGCFEINPSTEAIDQAIADRKLQLLRRKEAELRCLEPAMTIDQHQIEIAANLGKVHDTIKAVHYGAEAIGLLRTELVFMSHHHAPDEATQEKDYRVVMDALAGRPLVVRTLDVGGDKPLSYLPIAKEENPFLGLRGIRLTLRKPELLRQQLTALIRAADDRPLRIMFPMIGRIEEWREAKAILDDVLQQNPCRNLEVGIMIEVPSAALLAPILAKEVDFFSIGTNDLTQYTLAIDRGHPILSAEADGLHPAVLLLIHQTVQAAHTHGKWVGICGELAADPKAVPILMGLHVDELSMSASSIPLVKAQIRELEFQKCEQLAQQALTCESATAVRILVE